MEKREFAPITDVEKLDEAGRLEYYLAACEYFGIPPDCHFLEFLWVDSGYGGRKLILYAKKAATDILREKRGINVVEMTKDAGDGYVMFTAKGVDKTGRIDMAVGAASTKGLSGKALIDAIATAQTRATRRLTLQFVGGGLLDESEIIPGAVVTDVPPVKPAPPPATVAPSLSKGQDVTVVEEKKPMMTMTEFAQTITDPVILATGEKLLDKYHGPVPIVLRTDTLDGLLDPPIVVPTHGMWVETAQKLAELQNLKLTPPDLSTPAAIDEEPKKKRRKKPREVVLDSQEPALQAVPAPPEPAKPVTPVQVLEPVQALPAVPAEVLEYIAAVHKAADDISGAVPAPTPAEPVKHQLTKEQYEELTKRLYRYRADILEPAGFRASEVGGMGTAKKIRLFAQKVFPNITDSKDLTPGQVESFFNLMDEKIKTDGATGLVKYIDNLIGVTS